MINSSNSDLILNYGGGKVGIGQVNQNQLAEMLNLRTTGTGLGFRMDTPSMTFKFRLDPIGYTIFDSDVNRFRVHQNGNIGIGVDVPNYKLHVSTTLFASEITVGNSLYAGSNKIINLDGNGKVQITTPSGSSLVQGTTTIIGTDDKIPVSVIKGLTSDATTEGTSNLYFTNARAVSAVSGGTLTSLTITNGGTLTVGSTVIINSSGKIPVSNLTGLTSDATTEGTSNLYFTNARAVSAVSGGTLTSLTITNGGTLTVGSTVIINSSGKIPVSNLTGLTSDATTEGTSNLYFTNARAVSAVSGGTLTSLTIASAGTLTVGSTVIINSSGKIPVSNLTGLTTDATTEGTTNKYFTNARAISAIATATITPAVVTVSSLLNLPSYTTALRPTAGIVAGTVILDSTLELPIFYTGTVWKNFAGVAV
jgi:biotin carboxyl carrier protein